MGELHLEIIVDRLKREFNVDANVGRPQVAYRETARKAVEKISGKFVRQTGGRGQYGHAVINLEPGEQGEGYEFVDKIVGGKIPKEYIPAVDLGIQEAMESGHPRRLPRRRHPDRAVDGSYHEVDSSEIAFKVAGSMAFKEAMKRAKPMLLEPMMAVEVVTPEDYLGDVMGNLNSRRGRVEHLEPVGNAQSDQGDGPARRDVRLRDRRALDDAGPGDVHDAVRPLRGSAAVDRRRAGRRAELRKEEGEHGQAEVRAHEAAPQRRHDRSHRPRQDDADRGDHEGARGAGRQHDGARLRRDRQRAGGAARGITINTSHVEYETENRHYAHVDCPGTPTTSRT